MKDIINYKIEGIVFSILAVLQVITAIICSKQDLIWFSIVLLLFATCSAIVSMVCFKHYKELLDKHDWDKYADKHYQKYLAQKEFNDYSGLH